MIKPNPFRWFKINPEIIRLAVMLYVRFPLSLRNVVDLLHERGVGVSNGTVRFWWHPFGLMFAAEIRKRGFEGSSSVFLTPKGTDIVGELTKTVAEVICDILEPSSESERKALKALLARVV